MNKRKIRSLLKKLTIKFPSVHIVIEHEEIYHRCTKRFESQWNLYIAGDQGWFYSNSPKVLEAHIQSLLST